MCASRVGALRSQAMVVSVLIAVGWRWMPDIGYWVAWHCSARLFYGDDREDAETNHICNVDPSRVLTWTFEVACLSRIDLCLGPGCIGIGVLVPSLLMLCASLCTKVGPAEEL